MKSSRTSAAAAIAVIVLLPVLYALSMGPALVLFQKGAISAEVLDAVYYPLHACPCSKPVERLFYNYCALWVDLPEYGSLTTVPPNSP